MNNNSYIHIFIKDGKGLFPPKRLISDYYDNNAKPSLLYFHYKLGVH